jgi:hypothetical protein
MNINTCLTEREILNQNGRVIYNSDGTLSVYTVSSITGQLVPQHLTKPCCDALGISGAYFDTTTQKCRWSTSASCGDESSFNLVLNPRGNDGTIFSLDPDETCTLSIDFDYLFKYSCSTLTDLVNKRITGTCETVLDVFESIGASMIINVVDTINNNNTLINVYEETFFNKIGSGNLYTYLKENNSASGIFICGSDGTTDCNSFNLYDLNASGTTINCGVPVTQLLQGLYAESGLPSTGMTEFKSNISENTFGPNWAHFNTEITNQDVINTITNKKVKLTIRLSAVCVDMCFLIDNIKLNKNCTSVKRNDIFVSTSPGFNIDKIRDNKKSWVASDELTHRTFFIGKTDDTQQIRNTDYYVENEEQILNTKEIDLDINIASAVETDVWCYISDNPCILTGTTIGTTSCVKDVYNINTDTCEPKTYCCSEYCGDANIDVENLLTQPLSSVTTIEDFEYYLTSELIDAKNRKTIPSYPTLRLLYDRYINSVDFCGTNSSKFDYFSMNKFANLIGNYWVDLIEQVVPATTIWGATRIYTNTIFDTEKFKYKGYTTLFGDNKFIGVNILSPATGYSCNASATTTVIMGTATGTTQFFNNGNSQTYDRLYVVQMNSGSEFVGNVTILGANGTDGGGGITECGIGVRIVSTQPTLGSTDGSATAIVNGSFGPVRYQWSNGATTQTINNLGSGTYTVTVYDTSVPGCYAKTSVNIVESDCNLTATASATSATGNTNNGTATVSTTGGFAPLSYSWNTVPVRTTQTITGLSAGTYTVTVTDASGCTANSSATVSLVPCNLSIVTSVTGTTGSDGAASVSVISGFLPYTYSWNTTPISTTQTITGLSAGTYTVTVTDAYGCQEIGYASVNNIACTLTAVTSTVSATGNTANGSATVTASLGTAPYTYSWNTIPTQTGATATGLTAGTYVVTVTDISGCTQVKTATVTNVPCILTGTVSTVSTSANTANGSATVTVTNGYAPYTYSWNTTPVQTGATATGLTAGTYVVTVTDKYLCTKSLSGTVISTACTLTGSVTTVDSINYGANGSATVTASLGIPPYTYSWNTTPTQTSTTATGLTAGTYVVTVTDISGCTKALTANVQSVCMLSGSVTTTATTGSDGAAKVTMIIGTPPYSYSWNTTPEQNGQTATGLTAGTYVVFVTDGNECTTAITANVVSCTLDASVSTTNSSIGINDGTATVTIIDGPAPYTYSWNTLPVQTGSTATGLSAGTYSVNVTDGSGCTISVSGTVVEAASMVNVQTNVSNNITITDVRINGVSATLKSGTMPNTVGTSATLASSQSGTVTISVDYTSSSIAQSIIITDSNGTEFCGNNSPLSGTIDFLSASVDGIVPVTVLATNSACA